MHVLMRMIKRETAATHYVCLSPSDIIKNATTQGRQSNLGVSWMVIRIMGSSLQRRCKYETF